jgi:DNA-directed RNA polymerase subunit L
MEIEVLEKTKKRLVFDLVGADHTLCNSLKNELWNDKSVQVAAYNVEHPLKGIPRMIIETTAKDPKKALVDAAARLAKKNKDFSTRFQRAK